MSSYSRRNLNTGGWLRPMKLAVVNHALHFASTTSSLSRSANSVSCFLALLGTDRSTPASCPSLWSLPTNPLLLFGAAGGGSWGGSEGRSGITIGETSEILSETSEVLCET